MPGNLIGCWDGVYGTRGLMQLEVTESKESHHIAHGRKESQKVEAEMKSQLRPPRLTNKLTNEVAFCFLKLMVPTRPPHEAFFGQSSTCLLVLKLLFPGSASLVGA
jgi:hypothetical protein